MRKTLVLFCMLYVAGGFADVSSVATGTDVMTGLFTRPQGSPYPVATGNVHFMQDLVEAWRYYRIQQEQRDSTLFCMPAPSQSAYLSCYQSACTSLHFQYPPIFYSLALDATLSNKYKNWFLYKQDVYSQFLAAQKITPSNLTAFLLPTPQNSLVRFGQVFQANDDVNNEGHYVMSAEALVYKHFSLYSSPDTKDWAQSLLQNLTVPGTIQNTDWPDADVNSASLLGAETLTANSPQLQSARDLIQNLSDATPKALLPIAKNQGTYAVDTSISIKSLAARIVERSHRGLAQYVLNEIKNRRVVPTTAQSLSQLQVLENMARARVDQSNDWISQLSSTSTEGLLREIAIIESQRLLFDYMHFRQYENIEAMLAAQLSQNENLAQALDLSQLGGNTNSAALINSYTP